MRPFKSKLIRSFPWPDILRLLAFSIHGQQRYYNIAECYYITQSYNAVNIFRHLFHWEENGRVQRSQTKRKYMAIINTKPYYLHTQFVQHSYLQGLHSPMQLLNALMWEEITLTLQKNLSNKLFIYGPVTITCTKTITIYAFQDWKFLYMYTRFVPYNFYFSKLQIVSSM